MEETTIDMDLVEELRKSKRKFGALAPIILDKHGNIVEGHHRNRADPTWPRITYDNIQTDEDRVLHAIAFNWHRREKSEAWKKNMLSWLAKHGNTIDQITEKTGLSKRSVYNYLPAELKGPEPEELSRARLARKEPQYINCEVCGIATNSPYHVNGKFYCDKHIPASPPGIEPTTQERRRAEQPNTESVPEPRTAEAPLSESDKPEAKAPKPEAIDTGLGITCGECNQTFTLIHVAKNLHRLQKITIAEAPS